MNDFQTASQGEFQCLELLDQEVQGYIFGGTLLANVLSNLSISEIEHHITPQLVKNHLFPFERFHHHSELVPIGSKMMDRYVPGSHPGLHIGEGPIP
jgi:hypothetical protein